MAEMNAWDVAILAVAGYVGILALVRLMRRRRDAVMAELQAEVSAQQDRKRSERRRDANRSGRGKQQPSAARGTKR